MSTQLTLKEAVFIAAVCLALALGVVWLINQSDGGSTPPTSTADSSETESVHPTLRAVAQDLDRLAWAQYDYLEQTGHWATGPNAMDELEGVVGPVKLEEVAREDIAIRESAGNGFKARVPVSEVERGAFCELVIDDNIRVMDQYSITCRDGNHEGLWATGK